MASCTQAELRITTDVANAIVEGDATIKFTEFDRNTNLGYDVFFELWGEDSPPDADDLLSSPPRKRVFVRADGRQTADLEWRPATIALDDLDEDTGALNYEELKLVVTVEPYIPVTTSRESDIVLLAAVGV